MYEDSPKSFPIEKAFEFAKDKNLNVESQKIQEFKSDEISPKLCRVVKKGLFIKLFEQHALYKEFVGRYWSHGNTLDGESRRAYCIKLAEEYVNEELDLEEVSEADDVNFAFDFKFAIENHLRDFLASADNLSYLEHGLKICNIDGRSGVEYSIDGGKGRIDILAKDDKGQFVVIELKKGKGGRGVVGQILYYMAWIDAHMVSTTSPCRGIILASDIPDELKLSASLVSRLKLSKYMMNFQIQDA
jgi:hypothetical protein